MKKAICFLIASAVVVFDFGVVSAQEPSRPGYRRMLVEGRELWVKDRSAPRSGAGPQATHNPPAVQQPAAMQTHQPATQAEKPATPTDNVVVEDLELAVRGYQYKESADFIRSRLNQYPTVRIVEDAPKTVEVTSSMRLVGRWYGDGRRQKIQTSFVRGANRYADRLLYRAGVVGREARIILRDETRAYAYPADTRYETHVTRVELKYINNQTREVERTLFESQEFTLRFRRDSNRREIVEVVTGDISSVKIGKDGHVTNIAQNWSDILGLATFMWVLDPKNPHNDPSSPVYGANKTTAGRGAGR